MRRIRVSGFFAPSIHQTSALPSRDPHVRGGCIWGVFVARTRSEIKTLTLGGTVEGFDCAYRAPRLGAEPIETPREHQLRIRRAGGFNKTCRTGARAAPTCETQVRLPGAADVTCGWAFTFRRTKFRLTARRVAVDVARASGVQCDRLYGDEPGEYAKRTVAARAEARNARDRVADGETQTPSSQCRAHRTFDDVARERIHDADDRAGRGRGAALLAKRAVDELPQQPVSHSKLRRPAMSCR